MNKVDEFLKALQNEDKDTAVLMAKAVLETNEMPLTDFYETYILRALRDFDCAMAEHLKIWKEHVRTTIIRTILEMSYPYVIDAKKEVQKIGEKILVLCPKEEYHEIGAILATHYFLLAGFDALYLGANTPTKDILSALTVLKPNYLALSVTNYYNLVETQQLTQRVKKEYPDVKIILGGQAFHKHGALNNMAYDYQLDTKEDIFSFKKVNV